MSDRDSRQSEGVLVVEGDVLIREATEAGWNIEVLFVAPGGTVVPGCGDVEELSAGVIDKVASTKSPRPEIAIVRLPEGGLSRSLSLGECDFLIVVAGVADPGNLGTILRSAEACGADAVVIVHGSVDATNPKVVRASAGSIFRVPVLMVDSLEDLAREGFVRIGTTSNVIDGVVDFTRSDLRRKVALVFGNEPHGIDDSIAIDEWVTIPLSGRVESLNVAMACSIICFEVARQRRAASGTVGAP